MIKGLLYFTVILSGVAFYYTGANRGYELGVVDGAHSFIIRGLQLGTVECHYKREHNERKSSIRTKTTPTSYGVFCSG